MTNDDFDRTLMDEAGLLPPPKDEVDRCNPWQDAMTSLLLGQALITFHLGFFYLQYLLPLLGSVLIYLGGRSLRNENRPFRLCWLLGGVRLAWNVLYLVLYATPFMDRLVSSGLKWPVSLLANGVALAQLLTLYAGTRLAFAAVGEPKPKDWLARGLTAYVASQAIAIWCDLVPLTEANAFSWLDIIDQWEWLYYARTIAAVILQIYFLVCLARQSETLAGRGFTITPAPVRFSGKAVGLAVFAAVALAVPAALFVFSHTTNGPAEAVTAPLAGDRAAVREQLLSLGLPEEVADMLDEEELSRCAGALEVRPLSPSRQNIEEGRSRQEGDLLLDDLGGGESAMTAWAVLLPENQVRYYYVFRWLTPPDGRFQDQFSIDPIGNYPTGGYAARLLWEQDGGTYTTAPQVQLAGGETEEEIDWNTVLFEQSARMELERLGGHLHESPWFNYAIPRGVDGLRGYLAYSADLASVYSGDLQMPPTDFYDSGYVLLRHQTNPFHYPFFSISSLGGARWAWNSDVTYIQSAWQLFAFYGNLW